MRAARRAAALDRRRHRLLRRARPLRRIRPLGAVELAELQARHPYYRPRGTYLAAAAAVVADLVERRRLRTGLELGPHLRPLLVGADVITVAPAAGLEAEGRVICHDARDVPWPVPDGAYDLFVALQVFEHLGTSQPTAFREVCRVARNAVISLPIDWVMDDPTNCHHGLTEATVLGWFAPRVPTRIVQGNPGPKRRVIYVFEGLDEARGERG